MRLFTLLLLLCSSSMAGAQTPDAGLTRHFTAPSWHEGQQWRVQVPLLQGSVGSSPHDSTTEFTTYKFQVLGRRTLRYEEQDGSAHIGQAMPPEDCWLVSITPSLQSLTFDDTSYHLYFRADDLSLREVHLILRNGRGGYFMYSGTRVNNDDEAKAVVEVDRGPFCNSMEPLLVDWPRFPLKVGGDETRKKPSLHEAITQTGTAEGLGVKVVLQSGRETAPQTWLPGDPWWRFAERDGLRKSRLVLGEQQPAHQVE